MSVVVGETYGTQNCNSSIKPEGFNISSRR